MTQAVAQYAAKKMLNSQFKKYQDKKPIGPRDPLYDYVPNPRKPGKTKKVKKQIPAYIPEEEAKVLAKVRKRAYMMDCALFDFMGTRFGWGSVIGLVPAFGDAGDGVIAMFLVWLPMAKYVPMSLNLQMLIIIGIDVLIGIVPFLGDLLDAWFKANTLNVRLFEKHLDKKYKPRGFEEEVERKYGKRPPPASVYEDFSDDEEERRQTIEEGRREDVRRPEPARTSERRDTERRGGGGGGFFGKSKRDRRPDVEMGQVPRP